VARLLRNYCSGTQQERYNCRGGTYLTEIRSVLPTSSMSAEAFLRRIFYGCSRLHPNQHS
jgi:hypothetical protein